MQKIIEYEDKEALYENPNIPDKNKVKSDDMNEIKSVVNGSLQGTNAMGSIVVDDISGKNLLNVNKVIAGGYDGSGNWVNSSNYITVQYIPVKANTQYIISSLSLDLTKYTALRVVYWNSSIGFISRSNAIDPSNNTFTFTTPNNTAFIAVCFYAVQTASVSDLTQGQLELGDTATTYTPYNQPVKQTSIGVKESCTFYADDFKCKNLLSSRGSNIINNVTITEQSDGSLILNGTASNNVSYYYCGDDTNYNHFSPLEKGGTFTLSSTTATGYVIYIMKSGGTIVASLSNGGKTTFTTTANETYRIFIRVNSGTTLNNIRIYPQLEVGSEATTYTSPKAFENNEIYSTNETIIGTWEDGKPLYRQVITATPNISSSTTSSSFDINIANVDQVFIKDMTKIADTSSSGYVFPFPYLSSTNTIGGYISVSSTKLTFNVRKSSGIGFYAIRLVLEYTKTSSSSRSIQSEEE